MKATSEGDNINDSGLLSFIEKRIAPNGHVFFLGAKNWVLIARKYLKISVKGNSISATINSHGELSVIEVYPNIKESTSYLPLYEMKKKLDISAFEGGWREAYAAISPTSAVRGDESIALRLSAFAHPKNVARFENFLLTYLEEISSTSKL